MNKKILKLSVAATVLLLSAACDGSGDAVKNTSNVIVSVGGKSLGADELRSQIPGNTSPEDSAALAKAIVRRWVERQLIEQVASEQVDMEEIERLTSEYRSELIMSQYRRAMARQLDDSAVSDDSILDYYNSHADEYKLHQPMIKGVYLKVPDDAPNLNVLRKLYRSEKESDVDKMEKAALSSAIHYNYFRDTWVPFEQVENRIPVVFDGQVRETLRNRKSLEVHHEGFVYLLSISEYLPSGSAMPYETARPLIIDRLLARERRAMDMRLRNDLYNSAVAKGIVVYPGETAVTP